MAPTPTQNNIQITEPHPSTTTKRQTHFLGTGRGGAGNYKRYPTSSLTSGPSATGPARSSVSSSSSTSSTSSSDAHKPSTAIGVVGSERKKVFNGIGGAGNARPLSERRMFSFDEELERQQRLAENASATPVYRMSVGRGGAGNVVLGGERTAQGKGTSVGSAGSAGSKGSVAEGLDRARRGLMRVFSRDA